MKLTDSVEPPALSQEVFSWKQTEDRARHCTDSHVCELQFDRKQKDHTLLASITLTHGRYLMSWTTAVRFSLRW